MSKEGIKFELVQHKQRVKKDVVPPIFTASEIPWLGFAATVIATVVVGALMTTIEHAVDSDNNKRYDQCLRALKVRPTNEEGKLLACHLNGNQFVVEGKQ